MAKTQEELNALKEEVETLNKKLHKLTDEEREQVSGGRRPQKRPETKKKGTHYKEAAPGALLCPQCNQPRLPHRVCPNCGYYDGKDLGID